ncbi:DUF4190 domain-containing protein [Microbacterium aerolatum]|uniref:DUF4190 domain-containing protein n=1 Tax=Microbacterium aerolatum TaxID=153731 RepID=A0A511ACK9_9MICO|nr:DUF4190 domain-containing protein [Microbacterium aerolatum]GEK85899.1 hypothetical protein MAE01_10750 [Microbacterium aerolatum]GGB19344.1 hypothetical protein GCM10007198_07420 [Microbacterium aerolatum]
MSDERKNPDPDHPQFGTPQYPDPVAPVAYPGAVAPGSMSDAPGSMSEQYPGYTGPSPYPPAPISQSPGAGGLAIAALIVGIFAFLLGWVPVIGFTLAVAGIVLGILAVRRPRGKAFGITAIVLSALGALAGLLLVVGILAWMPIAN